jgi:hypothetical protein
MSEEPVAGLIVEQRDASVVEQWDLTALTYRRWDCTVLVEERPFNDAEVQTKNVRQTDQARQANETALIAKARAAFSSNAAYLAKVAGGTATNADHIGQVPALTRQMQGLIRLAVGADLLDAITDVT